MVPGPRNMGRWKGVGIRTSFTVGRACVEVDIADGRDRVRRAYGKLCTAPQVALFIHVEEDRMRINSRFHEARARIGVVVEAPCQGMVPKLSTSRNMAESGGLAYFDGRFGEVKEGPGAGQALLEPAAPGREAHAARGAALETGTRAEPAHRGRREMGGGGYAGTSGYQNGQRATGKVRLVTSELTRRHLLLLFAEGRAGGGGRRLDTVATAAVTGQGPILAVVFGHGG